MSELSWETRESISTKVQILKELDISEAYVGFVCQHKFRDNVNQDKITPCIGL